MNSTITIPLSKKERARLTRLALQYGFSLPEFSRYILKEITSQISEESFKDYENPRELKTSFERALRDLQAGRISAKL